MMDWFFDFEIVSYVRNNFQLASWYALLLSIGCWSLIYFVIKSKFTNKSAEWCDRLITFIHGLGTAVNGLNECFRHEEWIFDNPQQKSSLNQMLLLVVSLGYFVFDLIWCLYYQTETKLMIAHHIYSCIAIYRMIMKETAGALTACGLGGMELTNPLLQLRWFLRSEGYYDSMGFFYVEIIFIILFFIMRLVFGTFFFVMVMFVHENDWEFRMLTTAIYLLSWMFMMNIVKYVYLKYFEQNIQHIEEDIKTAT